MVCRLISEKYTHYYDMRVARVFSIRGGGVIFTFINVFIFYPDIKRVRSKGA